MLEPNIVLSAFLGASVSLTGVVVAWLPRERSDRRRLRAEKLEALIRVIHRANILAKINEDGYVSSVSEQETENAVSEIDALVSLHFSELRVLSNRVGKAFSLSLCDSTTNKFVGELRGLEQDVMALWGGSKNVLRPDRKLPEL